MGVLYKYGAVARVSLQNALIYRANLVGGLMFYSLFIFIFFHLWRAIYSGGEIAGYTLTQMIWYLCMTELVVYGCRTNVSAQIRADIQSGSISYLLSRPYSYVGYQFANALGGIGFHFCCFGALMTALGMIFVGPIPGFAWWALPFVFLSALLGMMIQYFLQLTIGLTAFVFEDNTALLFLFNKIVFMLGMFMPIEILPGGLQLVARALPFSYVAWAPAKLFVGFSWELFFSIFPIQLLWTLGSIGICMSFFKAQMNRVQINGG